MFTSDTRFVAAKPIKKKDTKTRKDPQYVSADKEKLMKKNKIPIVQIKTPFWLKILLYLLFAILIYLAFELFLPLLKFQLYRSWWKKNGGNKYKQIFSINLLAYHQNFLLYYYVLSLTGGGDMTMTNDQATFIFSMITNYGKYNDEDINGFLLPYNICENITVDIDPPTTAEDWKDLFTTWGYPNKDEYSGSVDELLQYLGKQENQDKWTKSKNNFLWQRYYIYPQSPLLVSFFSGSYSGLQQEKWDPNAFLVAVGISPFRGGGTSSFPIGGWWGYCKYGVSTASFSNLTSYVYSTYSNQKDFKPAKKCKDSTLGFVGGILQGASTGAMAGAVAGPEGAFVGALVMAGFSAFRTGKDYHCF
jgi:hypothetical protein